MSPLESNEEWRILQLEASVKRHDQDLYYGNGKPGLTTRMSNIESSLDSIKFYGRWIMGILSGVIGLLLANLILHK